VLALTRDRCMALLGWRIIRSAGETMNKPLIMCSIGVSILFGSMACQKEGLTSGAGTGGGLSQGGAGGVVLPTGGSPDTGGIAGTGGLVGAGGLGGTGGLVGQGGGIGSGGLVGTGAALGSGGASVAGGTISSGGARGTGGFTGAGAAVGVGGAPGLGGAPRTGGKSGAGGGLVGGSGTGGRIGTGGTSASGGAGGFSGTGGATSKMCGGIAGLTCPASQFCDMLPVGDCGKSPDAAGTCAATGPLPCAAIYLPVCGCDGKTYGNDCERQAAGVSMASQGACPAATACPTDISQIGTWPCTEGLTCEYGTDPRPNCRPSATCTNGIWTVLQAKCTQLPPVTCPATRDAAVGQVCPTDQAYCVYGDLSCVCTNCSTGPVNVCGGSFTWHCAAPNADPACPPGIPLLGSACSTNGQACTYTCGAGGGRTCNQSAWYAANGGPCPVSTRRAKKDILYLGSADRQRVADDLARFKLATYEYRDPALAGIRHLGFIIEDVPGSPAVNGDGNMVDLYGYASMLVAAVQAQGEEIRKLKAELSRLKRRAHGK